MGQNPCFDFVHGDLASRFRGDRRHAAVRESAGVDAREPPQVGRDVQREPVHGDITRRTHSYCAYLARASLSVRRGPLADPDARSACDAARGDAVAGRRADHGLLQRGDVFPQADPEPFEVENRVADQLPRAVEGDVAAAVDVKELRAHRFERRLRDEQVLRTAALAERIDRRMLHQKDRAGILRRDRRSVRFPGGIGRRSLCSGRVPDGIGRGPLAGREAVEQGLLQIPAGFVIHLSEVPEGDFHRCNPFTLRRASSAMYDDRTSGALAQ